jgi:hypothetical protein
MAANANLALLPALVAGTALGVATARRMTQATFEGAAPVLSGVSATVLLLYALGTVKVSRKRVSASSSSVDGHASSPTTPR